MTIFEIILLKTLFNSHIIICVILGLLFLNTKIFENLKSVFNTCKTPMDQEAEVFWRWHNLSNNLFYTFVEHVQHLLTIQDLEFEFFHSIWLQWLGTNVPQSFDRLKITRPGLAKVSRFPASHRRRSTDAIRATIWC